MHVHLEGLRICVSGFNGRAFTLSHFCKKLVTYELEVHTVMPLSVLSFLNAKVDWVLSLIRASLLEMDRSEKIPSKAVSL